MADLCCGRGTGGGDGKRPGSDVKAGKRRPPLGAFASNIRDASCLIKCQHGQVSELVQQHSSKQFLYAFAVVSHTLSQIHVKRRNLVS